MTFWIEEELCNGCQRCFRACPYDAIEMRSDKAFILERCTGCGACLEACRQEAIKTDLTPRTIPDFSAHRGVWVLVESPENEIHPVSLELLGEARRLGEKLEQKTTALVLGEDSDQLVPVLENHGAEEIIQARLPESAAGDPVVVGHLVAGIVASRRPAILLVGATPWGRDLAPRLARRLETGLTADCTGLEIDPEEKILLQTRPAFGGNVMATIACRYSRLQMATVRPGVMATTEFPGNRADVCEFPLPELPPLSLTRLEVIARARERVRLQQARVIVAGGRGTGGEKGFKLLKNLAERLGAELAGTRIAVEEGWLEADRQVGQTGQSVRPELYIACGISGAIQHRAGMLNSRYIIAINQDPRAPIFEIADWGIVGDLHRVVPEMISRLTEAE
jgi:electron transfer flavoprotein alpha subunit